jgi:Sulfatase
MDGWLQIGIGGALALAGWLLPRRVAAACNAASAAILVDLLPVAVGAALLLLATGRPILSGLVVLALGGGLALVDHTKRAVLREPVVFSDMSELPHVFTHPQLYLPFAGPGLVIGGAAAAVVLGAALLYLEPRLWAIDREMLFICLLFVVTAIWLVSREPVLSGAAAALRRLHLVGEPLEDAARLGPFAVLLAYGVIARAERAERRARHAPLPAPSLVGRLPNGTAPVVLVQCESFFDARRLASAIPRDLLPGFDRCRAGAAWYGRLDVSGWGANTMRAEFAALTGIPDGDLGYDRFNPYHALARAPVASLARDLRGQGYRTLCLHPFDGGFFRRREIMPKLGFEQFLCRRQLGGSRRPPYFADADLARLVLDVIDREGSRVFIFAITMGNHGPWRLAGPAISPDLAQRFEPDGVPQGGALLRYLDGLRGSDEMLEILVEGLERRGGNGVLGFYGDHLPSLPQAFAHFGFDEWTSDYVLWPGAATAPRQRDLPAHRLPQLIIEALGLRHANSLPAIADAAFVDGAA